MDLTFLLVLIDGLKVDTYTDFYFGYMLNKPKQYLNKLN
jgi:hypothetical protein